MMWNSAFLFGFEIGTWPALLLLVPIALGSVGVGRSRAITKAWNESGESSPRSRFRVLLPRFCCLIGLVFVVFALADISRRFVVVENRYAMNRLYLSLDNSGSMWNWYDPRERNERRNIPIRCVDRDIKNQYPRIWNACRAVARIVDATEEYAKKKSAGERKDIIGLLRFGLYSFVEIYGTSDYDRVRRAMEKLDWRDPRIDIYTEIHLALWDMFQVALQRNFRRGENVTFLDDKDRLMLIRSLYPEGLDVRYHPPRLLEPKLIALRKDLRDTAFIIISDAQEGQFEARLDKTPVSLVKMMQLAEFLEMPVYIISIWADNEIVRKLVGRTGHGPIGGKDRGEFYLLKGEKNFAHMDEIVNEILSSRFRVVATQNELRKESYTSYFAGIALLFICIGMFLSLSRYGRTLNGNEGGL